MLRIWHFIKSNLDLLENACERTLLLFKSRKDDFTKILTTSLECATEKYDKYEQDQMDAYDMLAAYFVQVSRKQFRYRRVFFLAANASSWKREVRQTK